MTAPDTGEVERRRARVVELCAALPEAQVDEPAGRHVKFSVRGRTFGYYLDDHHGDGMVVVCVKAAPGEQQALVGADPDRYVVPDYLGNKGWVSLRIDGTDVDWDDVREMVVDSYRLVAPKRLAAQA